VLSWKRPRTSQITLSGPQKQARGDYDADYGGLEAKKEGA
jgi:hypothetical protein